MLRGTGWAASFVAALTMAVVPALPARAGVLPPSPIAQAAPAARGPDAGGLADRLVEAGMPRDQANELVAGLGADEQRYLAERIDSAEEGGVILSVPAFVAACVVLGIMLIVQLAGRSGDPDAAAAPAPSATTAPATTLPPPVDAHEPAPQP